MSKYKMDIYTAATSVQMTISWDTAEHYSLGRQFLIGIDAGCGQPCDPSAENPEFFYLQNREELDALLSFRQKLKNG